MSHRSCLQGPPGHLRRGGTWLGLGCKLLRLEGCGPMRTAAGAWRMESSLRAGVIWEGFLQEAVWEADFEEAVGVAEETAPTVTGSKIH